MVVLFAAICANAQTVTADFTNLDKLVAQITKDCAKAPNATGNGDVDNFVDASKKAAVASLDTAVKLHGIYEGLNGNSNDATLAELVELAKSVVDQTTGLKELGESGKKAAEAVKKEDKMKAMKLAKPLKWATDLTSKTSEVLAEEAKVIDEIIKLLKSAN